MNVVLVKRSMRWLTLLLAFAVVAIGSAPLALAQGTPRWGGTLTIGMPGDVQGLDAHKHATYPTQIVLSHIYDQLVAFDEDLNVVPALAQSWDVVNDGKTYIFHLVRGRKFHDGSELTAEDVKYSFDRLRTESARPADYAMIDNIEIIDDYTVAFHLKEATPAFLPASGNFMLSKVVSKRNAEEQISRYGEIRHPIGTGPYRLVEWIPSSRIVLERFEDHEPLPGEASGMAGARNAYLDRLVFLPIPDDNARLVALQTGQIDIAFGVPPQEMFRLEMMPGIEIQSVASGTKTLLNFDHAGPFGDVRLRRAVALALDYDEIVEAATWGYGEVNHSFIPSFQGAWRSPIHEFRYERNLDLARQLVREAGYDGRVFKLYTSRAYPFIDQAAVIIQSHLAEIGINVAIEYVEWPALVDMWYAGDLGGNMMLMWIGMRADPNQYYFARLHTTATHNSWSNPEFDAIVTEAAFAHDMETRRQLYDKAQQILLDEVPLLLLFDSNVISAQRSNVKGFRLWGTDIYRFWNVWKE